MKFSGAVAMADDPGHAFGIYFEKIPFDAQEEKPHFNPDDDWCRDVGEGFNEIRVQGSGQNQVDLTVARFDGISTDYVYIDLSRDDAEWLIAKLKAALAP